MILCPGNPLASSKLRATLSAVPVALYYLSSCGTKKESTCKSSSIEFKVNSQSYSGTKNFSKIALVDPAPLGSFFEAIPSCSYMLTDWYSFAPLKA